ncbi:hypothetical protein N8T08_002625 [Aspergillus melleus]|uniref:Uncharacterized protein n=1 Tax=Aspergillus melleus TaxID=138277 RepID=A0ACC3ALX6_9EURO|nr:hypothetical protein N8T08_002625 [Aspergillus melleus]
MQLEVPEVPDQSYLSFMQELALRRVQWARSFASYSTWNPDTTRILAIVDNSFVAYAERREGDNASMDLSFFYRISDISELGWDPESGQTLQLNVSQDCEY